MSHSALHATSVPAWPALFADPSLFDSLPAEAQEALYEQVATLEARLRARLLTRHRPSEHRRAEPDRTVRIEEAVELLGIGKDFLYRKWKALDVGGYRDDDGHVKFPWRAPRSSNHTSSRSASTSGAGR